MSDTFTPLMPAEELPIGQIRTFIVGQWPVLVARTASGYFGLLNRCSHAASSFDGGRVRRNLIICPMHGAPFDLPTGACAAPTRYDPLRTFPLRIEDGMIEVAVPAEPPSVHELPVVSTGADDSPPAI